MNDLTRKILWAALILSIILSILYEKYTPPSGRSAIDTLQKSGFGYNSRDILLTPSEISIYSDARVLKRWYNFSFHNFILIVVDAGNNRHAVHDPLYCFNGAGWQIHLKKKIKIDGSWAHFLKMSKDGIHREVLYWFSDGYSRHASVVRFWFQATMNRLTFGFSNKVPFMVILQPFKDNQPDWQKILDQFGLLYEI